uniref:G-protein coupled receptors family 1 profile domain-containing protein n=1 Tax=Panagrolaimus superbus TaxID=310955 RepID=A0A914XQ45_9BILA
MAVELNFSQNVNKPYDSIWPNVTCENDSPWPSCLSLGTAFVTIAFMLIVMLVIVLGNLLVVLTVNNDHKLRSQRQNWLIVSLAIADLLVGLLVMPLTMTYEIIGVWVLGDILCELWLALDVLFVTASILHICIISLDRYWSVTQPLTYPSKRTPQRITIMIGVAWSVSLLICMPPILGWRQPKASGECSTKTCEDNINVSKIAISINGTSSSGDEIYLPQKFDNNNTIKVSPEKKSKVKQTFNRKLFEFNSLYTKRSKWMSSLEEVSESSNGKKPTDKRRKLLKAKERQATMLLGLILTAFIASWLPFFVLYVLGAFSYEAPTVVFKFFFWLGYCNSGINPVIYTVFNREFKRALCRQLRRQQRAILSFWEHFG